MFRMTRTVVVGEVRPILVTGAPFRSPDWGDRGLPSIFPSRQDRRQ
jgi:hypothetical protein